MRGPTEEARAEARRRYTQGESLSGIAKATGIDRKTLRSMKEREGWIPQVIPQVGSTDVQQIQAQTRQNVIDFTTRQSIEYVAQSGVIEAQADLIAENLTLHGQIGNMALLAIKQTFEQYLAGGIEAGINQNRADVLKSVLGAAKSGVDMTRDIAGLKAGQISAKNSKDDGRKKFEFVTAHEPEQVAQAS